MRMPAQQHVAGLQGRGRGLAGVMPVGGKDKMPVQLHQAVIRQDREGEDHLVHLRLAVAADAEKLGAAVIQKGDDLLWGVAVGQVVPGSVIEQVAQEQDAVRLLPVRGVEPWISDAIKSFIRVPPCLGRRRAGCALRR